MSTLQMIGLVFGGFLLGYLWQSRWTIRWYHLACKWEDNFNQVKALAERLEKQNEEQDKLIKKAISAVRNSI